MRIQSFTLTNDYETKTVDLNTLTPTMANKVIDLMNAWLNSHRD